MKINNVAVIGTGVIGSSWISSFLASNLKVVAYDISKDKEKELHDQVSYYLSSMISKDDIEPLIKNNLQFVDDISVAVANADFIQENGPERLEIKKEIINKIEKYASDKALIVSSTSGFLPSDLQEQAQHPERIAVGHPFNPPHLIPLVEVVGGEKTSAQVIETVIDFYNAIGKKAVHIKKEVKGHAVNRLQAALLREAFYLINEGVISLKDLDASIAHGPGLRWAILGPCMNFSLSGGSGGMQYSLDHFGPSYNDWWKEMGVLFLKDSIKEKMVKGIDDELAGHDQDEIIKKRDILLKALMDKKTEIGFEL